MKVSLFALVLLWTAAGLRATALLGEPEKTGNGVPGSGREPEEPAAGQSEEDLQELSDPAPVGDRSENASDAAADFEEEGLLPAESAGLPLLSPYTREAKAEEAQEEKEVENVGEFPIEARVQVRRVQIVQETEGPNLGGEPASDDASAEGEDLLLPLEDESSGPEQSESAEMEEKVGKEDKAVPALGALEGLIVDNVEAKDKAKKPDCDCGPKAKGKRLLGEDQGKKKGEAEACGCNVAAKAKAKAKGAEPAPDSQGEMSEGAEPAPDSQGEMSEGAGKTPSKEFSGDSSKESESGSASVANE